MEAFSAASKEKVSSLSLCCVLFSCWFFLFSDVQALGCDDEIASRLNKVIHACLDRIKPLVSSSSSSSSRSSSSSFLGGRGESFLSSSSSSSSTADRFGKHQQASDSSKDSASSLQQLPSHVERCACFSGVCTADRGVSTAGWGVCTATTETKARKMDRMGMEETFKISMIHDDLLFIYVRDVACCEFLRFLRWVGYESLAAVTASEEAKSTSD